MACLLVGKSKMYVKINCCAFSKMHKFKNQNKKRAAVDFIQHWGNGAPQVGQ